MADERRRFDVSLVTPEGAAFEGEAEMIIVPGEDEGRLAGEELLVRRDHVDLHRHAETPQPDSESRLAFSIAWSMPPTM